VSRRQAKVKKLLEAAALACNKIVEEAADITGELKLGEVLHAQLGLKPNQIVVLAVFENVRASGWGTGFELRCHICEELLSQTSLASWPVFLRRTEGSPFPAVLMTCDDEACRQRLMEKLDTEGP